MASQKELFRLIKSLEKSEKQAIALERKKKNKLPNYLLLYDWLEEQNGDADSYDRAEVTKQINKRQASKWKESTIRTAEAQLYDKIIEILALTKLGKSPISTINLDIAKAEVLKNKGFYTQSLDHLSKASDNAYKYQKHSLIVEIIPRRIDVILLTKYKNRKELVEEENEKLRRASAVIQQEIDYRNLNVRLFLQYQESRNPNHIPSDLKEDYFQLMAKKFPEEGSFFAQYYFHSIQAIWAIIHKDPRTAYEQQQAVVDIWLQEEPILQTNGQSYLTQLANLTNYAITAKDFKAAKAAIGLLKNFKPTNNDEEAEQLQDYLFYKQYLLLNEEKFQEAKALIPEIKDLLIASNELEWDVEGQKATVRYKRINPSRLYNFYYNTLITLLLCHEYNDAQHWLTQLDYLYKKKEPRKDVIQFIRILQLIISYGLESDKFMERMFDKLYRQTEVKKNMSKLEKEMFYFFKKLLKTEASTERKDKKDKSFEELLNTIEQLPEADKKVVGYEEIVQWIKSILHKNTR
jgi:hypothetical protein